MSCYVMKREIIDDEENYLCKAFRINELCIVCK